MLHRRRGLPTLTAVLAAGLFLAGCTHTDPGDAAGERLRREVRDSSGFRQARAAEYLGEDMGAFPADSSDPKVRIVQLRVRYAGGDFSAADVVRRAALNTGAPEQLHALETSAKLGLKFAPDELEAIRRIALADRPYFAGYANWILAANGDAEAVRRLDGWIVQGGKAAAISAYAAGYLPTPPPGREAALKRKLESGTPAEQAFSLWSLARHGMVDAATAWKKFESWSGKAGLCRFALLAVGEAGTEADVPRLVKLLDSGEPEVANAAAAAILNIRRRGARGATSPECGFEKKQP